MNLSCFAILLNLQIPFFQSAVLVWLSNSFDFGIVNLEHTRTICLVVMNCWQSVILLYLCWLSNWHLPILKRI